MLIEEGERGHDREKREWESKNKKESGREKQKDKKKD